jgi:hypothetical protein
MVSAQLGEDSAGPRRAHPIEIFAEAYGLTA